MRLVSMGNFLGVDKTFAPLFDSTIYIGSSEEVASWSPKKGDVVLFGGGADISTSFYGESANSYSNSSEVMSGRDTLEHRMFNKCLKFDVASIGVCRGAQLLCCLSGGKLIQHVNGHSKRHLMATVEGELMEVSSLHHQMMSLKDVPHTLFGWSSDNLSTCYLGENDVNLEDIEIEPEVVFFEKTKSLAFQYHPELMGSEEQGRKYALQLVKTLFLGD